MTGLRDFIRTEPDPDAKPLTAADLEANLRELWESIPPDYNPMQGVVRIEGSDGWKGMLMPHTCDRDDCPITMSGLMRQNDERGFYAYQIGDGPVVITEQRTIL